jgi:NTE family protein
VLGGGGARGAYEAGVLLGLFEVLAEEQRRLVFDVLCGSSIGALNAAWLAAHAHEDDHGVHGLIDEWRKLRLEDSVRLHHRQLLPFARRGKPSPSSILDPAALELLMTERMPWTQLHYNLASGTVQALIVTALDIASGQTTTFAQLGPNASYRPTRDPRRNAKLARMSAQHVLASSAFPWLFPAREIDGHFYCDGGLRYNTPISPALRAGADRLVVVSLLAANAPEAPSVQMAKERVRAFPNAVFLLGKLLAALLLDPVQYDLQVLERFNTLMSTLEDELSFDEMRRVNDVMVKLRGVSYRRVPTLVFRPSRDLGSMASEFLERRARPRTHATCCATSRDSGAPGRPT